MSESWIFFDLSTDQKLCTLFIFKFDFHFRLEVLEVNLGDLLLRAWVVSTMFLDEVQPMVTLDKNLAQQLFVMECQHYLPHFR